jgi:hypothetical protein
MKAYKNLHRLVGTIIFVPMLMFFVLVISPASLAEPMSACANQGCAKQRAILRQLERTRPSKKLTRMQIFNRIKAACNQMRRLNCPGIQEFRPEICFTDF